MKPIKLSLFFILISIITIFGQNYQSINSKRISYFDDQNGNINCIRIDSVKYQTDSIFYPFTVIQQFGYNCFSPSVASWIGKNVTIKKNGTNEFVNKRGDTIFIKTNANLGDKWTAYEKQDSLTIIASVITHDTLSFLGIKDSVKTIEFQPYDKNLNKIDLGYNNNQLQISKNYGFVKTFNFYLFPDLYSEFWNKQFEKYDLIGLSNPKVGVNNLTWFEVNDFQIGDEFHIMEESSCWNGFNGNATTKKSIYKYLDRMDYSDSIVYHYSRKESIKTTWSDSSAFNYYNDTLKVVIKPDTTFDKLPGEPIIIDNYTYNHSMTNELPLSKSNTKSFEFYVVGDDSFWHMPITDGCIFTDKYIKGLGGPYYSCKHTFCFGNEERILAYYKKGDITWGKPLEITGSSDISTKKNILIYPNPAKTNINITLSNKNVESTFLYIYDILGKLRKTQHLVTNNSTIDISNLNSGTYIIKISDNNQLLKMDRLIIE